MGREGREGAGSVDVEASGWEGAGGEARRGRFAGRSWTSLGAAECSMATKSKEMNGGRQTPTS
jgi:hypothetical protein